MASQKSDRTSGDPLGQGDQQGGAMAPATSPLRTVLEVIGLTLVAFVVSLLVGITFIVPLFALGYDIETTPVLVGTTVASQLGFLAVGYGYVRYRRVTVPIAVPSRRDLGYIVGGCILALVAAVGLSYVLAVLDLVPESVIEDAGSDDSTFFLALAALSVVLVAPTEELLFRGAIQGRLRIQFGPAAAIAGASLLFGSMHLANYGGNVLAIVAGALLIAGVGSVFGMVYERTDNLVVPILVHAIYNVVLLVTSYLAATMG